MNKQFLITVIILLVILVSSVSAEESPYIKKNKDANWQKTEDSRLEYVINNPVKFKPEEYIAALHEYAKRHGIFSKVKIPLEAYVNAYIAQNPGYKYQYTEDIFVQVARSRGVQSVQNSFDAISYVDNFQEADSVSLLIEKLDEFINTSVLLDEGQYGDGSPYTIYQVNDNTKTTISTDINGTRKVVYEITSAEAMQEVIKSLTETIYTKQISYIKGGYIASFQDDEFVFIDNTLSGYLGTIKIIGSQMLVEEITPHNKIITQRQWCTVEFYNSCTNSLGDGWGFIAPWDNSK